MSFQIESIVHFSRAQKLQNAVYIYDTWLVIDRLKRHFQKLLIDWPTNFSFDNSWMVVILFKKSF